MQEEFTIDLKIYSTVSTSSTIATNDVPIASVDEKRKSSRIELGNFSPPESGAELT